MASNLIAASNKTFSETAPQKELLRYVISSVRRLACTQEPMVCKGILKTDLGARTLGAPGLTTSNKKLLGAPGRITTRGSWPYY